MKDQFTARASVIIQAPASQVWQALTTPAIIKQYFFGVDVLTDWKEGSPILYRGQWQGKRFEDKGQILRVEPEKVLVSTHWSPLSGVPDTPDNYHTVRYELHEENGGTRVTISQDNNASQQEKDESEKNWNMMLEGLKKVVESQAPEK